MSKIFEFSSFLVQRVILASFILWPFEVPKYTGQLLSSIFQGWKAKMYGGNLYLDLRHSGISKKITKPFLLGLLITTHKTKANIFAQPSSRAFTEYTHCVRPSLAFHVKAVPVHKGGFSTPVKMLLLLKIWRLQGCIVYRVMWCNMGCIPLHFCWYWNSEPGKKCFQTCASLFLWKALGYPLPCIFTKFNIPCKCVCLHEACH